MSTEMTDSVSLVGVSICCDSCSHEFSGALSDWLDKACPRCGEPGIINGGDMAVYEALISSIELLNNILPQVSETGPSFSVRIETSGLRK